MTHLKNLVNFPAWEYFRNDLLKQVSFIENSLYKIDFEANKKVYTKHDILRIERNILKMIIDLPDDLIEQLNQITIEETKEDEY